MTPIHTAPRRFLRAAHRALRRPVGETYLHRLTAPLRATCRRLWAARLRQEPHRCRFDSQDGLLYAGKGLVILRCRCGVTRLFGRW